MRSQKGHLLIDVRYAVGYLSILPAYRHMASANRFLIALRFLLPFHLVELTLDVSNVLAPPKQKSSSVQKEKAPPVESPTTASSPKVDVKSKKPQSTDAKVVENGVAYDKNEDESAKSAPNSPFASSTVGSPSREFQILTMERQQTDDHAGVGSMFSGDNGCDEPAWGTFDTNDDVDSVWGFNAFSTTKIWAHADQRQIGFLGQAEFYNALRLVTVAQSKRELTPEMVKAALYGLAAAKIPTPRINLAATPAPQFNSAAAAPATQGGAVTATSS
ncbi:hypothetical protein C1H46_000531 [Malus baccata]|uniref:EH domain-containing protein n=1 Tax=Malus baccata TaxID=106549 RepID=A0A540NTK6_MALBA|nr:hypothetical protein C1H46_000531 [Malus baccata]